MATMKQSPYLSEILASRRPPTSVQLMSGIRSVGRGLNTGFKALPRNPSQAWSALKATGRGITHPGVGSALGGVAMAAGLWTTLGEIGKAAKARPILHIGQARQGLAGTYTSLGEMPTSGVRFAGRYRRNF